MQANDLSVLCGTDHYQIDLCSSQSCFSKLQHAHASLSDDKLWRTTYLYTPSSPKLQPNSTHVCKTLSGTLMNAIFYFLCEIRGQPALMIWIHHLIRGRWMLFLFHDSHYSTFIFFACLHLSALIKRYSSFAHFMLFALMVDAFVGCWSDWQLHAVLFNCLFCYARFSV